jgi:poly(3-hydroxybutyrate) depolymerase
MAIGSGPSFEELAFTDSLSALNAAADGVAEYWRSAITRQATPAQLWLESLTWLGEVAGRRRPTWSTANTVVFEAPVARLRDFSPGKRGSVVPTLVLPPQAGHDSCIVDYSPTQSQMQTVIAAGLTDAYSLDWIGATEETKDAGIEEYLQVIDEAVTHAGGRVNLIGDCQGGWLATIYAALSPERVNTLTIGGAPIDFHAGGPAIVAAMDCFAPGGDLAFYRALVKDGNGRLDGRHLLAGFIAMQPQAEVSRQLALLAHIDDPAHVARYREFEDWFKYTQPIPGAFYLWIVEQLFRDNKMISGELEIAGESVDLGRITCPLNLLAGSTDHITPAPQVFALADHAATDEADVMRDTAPSGHLGLFMGHDALANHWPRLLAAVLERSI